MSEQLAKDLKALGAATNYYYDEPRKDLLETFPSPHTGASNGTMAIEITAPEFTSLCPKTGQPDFATIVISYVPRNLCVESKSLKLYLGSFRMYGEFHESCVHRIHADLLELLACHYLKVEGQFTPRGGIKFWPSIEYQSDDFHLF